MHIGDTGDGLGVALIWTAGCAVPSASAKVRPSREDRSGLLIDDGDRIYLLAKVDPRCRSLALVDGLHVIWQQAGAVDVHHCKLAAD